jgi:hypothetical protein
MTQPINQDVMELVAGGGNPKNQKVDAAKEQIKKIIAEQKIDPRQLIRVGQLANFALQNNSLYPMVMEQMVKEGLADPEDAQQPPDFKALAGLVSSGKIAEMLINESQQK